MDAQGIEEWHFTTHDDFDAMTGVVVTFRVDAAGPRNTTISFALLYSPELRFVIRQWESRVPQDASGTIDSRLPGPIPRFSLGRGGVPFALYVDTRALGSPTAIDVPGIKVDIRGYTIVNREGRCVTAVRHDLLEHGSPPGPSTSPHPASIGRRHSPRARPPACPTSRSCGSPRGRLAIGGRGC